MITAKEIKEIRNFLKNSENPLFLFDNDCDGLCSYLLFRKYINSGIGVSVKGAPTVDVNYIKYIKDNNPDKVFILDKPIVEQEFIDKVNVPIIWIDHHMPVKRKGINYYNPRIRKLNEYRPTTYLCYKVVNKDLWIAMVGILSDWYVPSFIMKFNKAYAGLLNNYKEIGDILYKSEMGRLIRIFSFILKGKNNEVKKHIEALLNVNGPYEILNKESKYGELIYKRYEEVYREYKKLYDNAVRNVTRSKILLYNYPSGEMSFTDDLANELSYMYKNKAIIVGREKEDEIKLSLRSRKIKILEFVEKALIDVEGYGGGHEHACGANIKKRDFPKFINNFRKLI